MIKAEMRRVFKVSRNGRSRSFFSLDAAIKWEARQIIYGSRNCECEPSYYDGFGQVPAILCERHEKINNLMIENPDRLNKIYSFLIDRVKKRYFLDKNTGALLQNT